MPQLMQSNQGGQGADKLVGLLQDLLKQRYAGGEQNQEQPANSQPMGSGMQVTDLSPMQMGVAAGLEKAAKKLKKDGEQHAYDAVLQGVPPEHIIEQSGLNKPQQKPKTDINPLHLLNSLLQNVMGAIPNSSEMDAQYAQAAQQRSQTALNQQKLAGQEPLQVGEKQKIGLENQNKFFEAITTSTNKQPSAQEATLIGNINSGISNIDSLMQELDQNPNIFKQWVLPGNPTRQSLTFMNNEVKDVLARLRSQGTINDKELKLYNEQLVKIGNIAAIGESPKVARFKLEKVGKLFRDIKSKIEPKTLDFSNKVNKLLQMGATQEQIYRVYKQGGL